VKPKQEKSKRNRGEKECRKKREKAGSRWEEQELPWSGKEVLGRGQLKVLGHGERDIPEGRPKNLYCGERTTAEGGAEVGGGNLGALVESRGNEENLRGKRKKGIVRRMGEKPSVHERGGKTENDQPSAEEGVSTTKKKLGATKKQNKQR